MSANVSMESGSSSQQQQQQPASLTKDDTTSSYATVVLSLKSQPRDQEKNDNNKENIGKVVNNIDASNKQNDVLAITVQPNQQQQQQPQPSTTSSDDVEQGNCDDDELFTPVVSNSRKERRNVRKDKPKARQLSGSGKPRDRGRTTKSENREKRDNNKKYGRERTDTGKDLAAKTETQTENATPKSGNEEEADAEPVKFVEAPIPKVNAWKERNGMGNGLDMRSLEHCLSDLIRGCGDGAGPPDHLKGYLNNPNTLQSLAQLHVACQRNGVLLGYRRDEVNVPMMGLRSDAKLAFPSAFLVTKSFTMTENPDKDESSVQSLIEACITDDDKLYLCVSSPTIKDKPVQIRPWRLSDADFVLDASMPLDPRKTVFVGGVPRLLKAVELAMIMNRLYGGVSYAGIDTDPELKYPKGAGRVAFSNQQSYIAAISARFVQLQHGDIDKRVELKPYVLDDQMCDECQRQRCSGKFAPFFCANVTCLQYYCEHCWTTIHSRPGREYHKPLVKEGADRPRAVPFRWC